MTTSGTAGQPGLVKLRDTDQTVANPDEDVRGRAIRDRDGEDLGKVDDLLIDEAEGRVRFLVAEHGGILGIGATQSFIPVDVITGISADEVHIDSSRDHVAGAPRYDPELGDELDFFSSIYGYYGLPPFWGPGYIPPDYPSL